MIETCKCFSCGDTTTRMPGLDPEHGPVECGFCQSMDESVPMHILEES